MPVGYPLSAYKILTSAEFAELQAGRFVGAPVDIADGYIHLSTADQLPETLARHFAGAQSLVIAAVDLDALGAKIRWEPSRGGALFPHLYGALTMADITAHGPVAYHPDGSLRLPSAAPQPPAIRDASEADLAAILAITNEAILNTTAVWSLTPATMETRRAWLVERQSRGFPVLAATHEGAVIGFASYGDFRPWEGYVHTVEHSVYVDPAAQGRGAGKALLLALITRAQAQGKHVMVAGIEAGNSVSLGLHSRLGFVETGRLPEVGRKFDRWLDLVLMQKILT